MCQLTPWRRILLQTLVVSQLVKEIIAFYATRKFIIFFTTAQHFSYPETLKLFMLSYLIAFRYILLLCFHILLLPNIFWYCFHLRLLSFFFLLYLGVSPTKPCMHFSFPLLPAAFSALILLLLLKICETFLLKNSKIFSSKTYTWFRSLVIIGFHNWDIVFSLRWHWGTKRFS